MFGQRLQVTYEIFCSHVVRVGTSVFLDQTRQINWHFGFQTWLSYAFYWGVASVWPLYHKSLIGGVLQKWLSFWKVLPSRQRNSGALSVTIRFLVTSLTEALLLRLFSLAGQPALGGVLMVLNFFHLRMMEATVLLGTFNDAEMFWYPSSDLCLDTVVSMEYTFDIGAWFLLWHGLSTGTLYKQKCVFSNNVLSIEFNQVVETAQGWSM